MPSRKFLLLTLLAACAQSGTPDPTSDDAYPFPTGDGKADSITLAALPIHMGTPTPGTFDQEIDHPEWAGASLGTFKQRYWYALDFAKGPDSPVLFYLCGEGPCSPWYASTMADAAKALNAAVVVLEHRYYGESLPYRDLTLDHMKYLTIRNALEDAAGFERFAKANLPLRGKWIAVGGSYPGMLAAFYREKHPDLVVGAWASSAPINVQLSFWGYDAIATRALGPTCALLFQQVLASADAAFDDPMRRASLASSLFGSAPPDQKVEFLQWFSYVAEDAAQYGYTRNLCAALEQESHDPMTGFQQYVNPPLVGDDGGPDAGVPDAGSPDAPDAGTAFVPDAGNGWADAGHGWADAGHGWDVPDAATPDHPPPMAAAIPHLAAPPALNDFSGSEWFYQVCTEVGFFQVHNPDRGQSLMSDLVDEQYWLDQCQRWVGKTPAIDETRKAYVDPIVKGQVTNVFFVNGSLDPWSSLSLIDPNHAPAGVTAFVVQTGSHCEDLSNLDQSSVLGVFQAHKKFHDLAREWLR